MTRTSAVIVLVGLLLLAGCAADNGAVHSDSDKNGGFYTGMSGGWGHP